VKEGLSAEHRGELLGHSLEHLLNARIISDEGYRHFQSFRWDITDRGLDVVGDPLNEVAGVLVLDVQHLLVNLLGGHPSSEQGGGGKVPSVSGVGGAHHVLGIEHLLGQLGHGQGSVLLGSSGGQRGESDHEEVKSGEGDQIDGDLSQVRVELTGESQAAGDTGHHSGDEMVQITEGGGGQLQGSEADIVQSLVVNAHDLIGVLDQLMDGEGGVVGFDDGIGHLGGGNDGEGDHHSVGVLLSQLGDQERSHSGSSSSSHGVADLESLKAVTGLGLLSADIKDGVDELSSLSVVTLGPVVTGTSLSEDEVVRSEDLAVGTSSDGIHSTWLQIHEYASGHVSASGGFVEVNVNSLQLKIGISLVSSGGVNTVLIGDDFPELGSDLVTALAGLDGDDLSHV